MSLDIYEQDYLDILSISTPADAEAQLIPIEISTNVGHAKQTRLEHMDRSYSDERVSSKTSFIQG